ncbi:MAG: TIGR03790 family protein [Thiobacillus sp.]|nr:TIGR03790 family protein [Thiobacillus sp.]
MRRRARPLLTALGFACALAAGLAFATPERPLLVSFDQPALTAAQLGVIVNDDDPDSVALADYYMKKRDIPAANLIHVRFRPGRAALAREEFVNLKRQVDRKTPKRVQAYALAWTQPYRVDCMSITSAFAFGFDPAYCASGCKPTQASPYFNSSVTRPYDSYRIRPTMSLAASGVGEAKKLVDRGVAADGSNPAGSAYLVSTGDKNRNVRAADYPAIRKALQPVLPVVIAETDALENRRDVMFYFTGTTHVAGLDSNGYLAGAIADHLTSTGGELFGGSQMSILKWLEAGATGSYGTVVEPCNFPAKFPAPGLVMSHYLQGETLLEAYWKSVAMPGQGLFVGEPLARPYAGVRQREDAPGLAIEAARLFAPGLYAIRAAPSMMGPYRLIGRMPVAAGTREIRLDRAPPAYYRFERIEPHTAE